MKIGLCLPIINRIIDRDFFISFTRISKPFNWSLYVPQFEAYSYPKDLADTRESLARQAMYEGCDKIIMMDTDQIYPTNTLEKLLTHDVPVVGAMVHKRYPPFAPLLYRGELGHYKYVSDEEMFSDKLVEVDATGCGCICYDKSVFEAIKNPWYELRPGEKGKPVGEDVRLCSKIRDAGFKIFVDTSIRVDHMTMFSVNRDFYLLYKQLNRVALEPRPTKKEK